MATQKQSSPSRPRTAGLTPLGIIATFVALSETVAGLAAVKTEGIIQILFSAFAVTFPVFIAGVFFAILWKRAYVLYPPQDFGSEIDVRHYVDAMRQQAVGNQEIHALVRATIAESLQSQTAQLALSEVTATTISLEKEALKKASEAIAEEAVDRLQRAVLTVDVSEFSGLEVSPELVFPFHAAAEAFTLLSGVYFQISDHVEAFSYGKSWALKDEETGRLILPATVNWSDDHALANSGVTVAQLGLAPGMRLRAVPLSNSAQQAKISRGKVRGSGVRAG